MDVEILLEPGILMLRNKIREQKAEIKELKLRNIIREELLRALKQGDNVY